MVVTQSKLTLPEDTWGNFGPWCVEPWATTSPHLCDIACCVSRFRSKRMTNLENTQLTQVPLLLYLLPRFNSVLPALYISFTPLSATHIFRLHKYGYYYIFYPAINHTHLLSFTSFSSTYIFSLYKYCTITTISFTPLSATHIFSVSEHYLELLCITQDRCPR